MIRIPLRGKNGDGKYALVDDEDYQKCAKYSWFYSNGYAVMSHKRPGVPLQMHRLVMSPQDEMVIDHLNHDRLDNRKQNLRVCTTSDNNKNRSGVRGYYYSNRFHKWVVKYRGNSYGYWDTEEEAIAEVLRVKSGGEYLPKQKRNRYRPKNITRNRAGSYTVQIQRHGTRHVKYGFKTIADAILYRDKYYKKIGVKIWD